MVMMKRLMGTFVGWGGGKNEGMPRLVQWTPLTRTPPVKRI